MMRLLQLVQVNIASGLFAFVLGCYQHCRKLFLQNHIAQYGSTPQLQADYNNAMISSSIFFIIAGVFFGHAIKRQIAYQQALAQMQLNQNPEQLTYRLLKALRDELVYQRVVKCVNTPGCTVVGDLDELSDTELEAKLKQAVIDLITCPISKNKITHPVFCTQDHKIYDKKSVNERQDCKQNFVDIYGMSIESNEPDIESLTNCLISHTTMNVPVFVTPDNRFYDKDAYVTALKSHITAQRQQAPVYTPLRMPIDQQKPAVLFSVPAMQTVCTLANKRAEKQSDLHNLAANVSKLSLKKKS